MRLMHEKDPAMNHERAFRTLSIQHRLHIGVTVPRPGLDDAGHPWPEVPRHSERRPALAFRTLFQWLRRRSARSCPPLDGPAEHPACPPRPSHRPISPSRPKEGARRVQITGRVSDRCS